MHRNLIEALYFGEINETTSTTFETEEYYKADREFNKLYEQLKETLNDEQKELLRKMLEIDNITSGEIVVAAYKDGFRMGMGLAVEGLKPIERRKGANSTYKSQKAVPSDDTMEV